MGKPVTCPYCQKSFDRITGGSRRAKAEDPLASAVARSLEDQLAQALNALRRTKDNERVLLAQLAEAERRGFRPTNTPTAVTPPRTEDLAGGPEERSSPPAPAPPAGHARGGTPWT